MPIYPRHPGYQVQVTRATALKGYRRIRAQASTYEDAKILEATIKDALNRYGKWPIEADDIALEVPPHIDPATYGGGTIRKAAGIALETHWKGTRYGNQSVRYNIWHIVDYLESLGRYDLDDINSEDMDKFIDWCRSKKNKPNSINKKLSILRVINTVARNRKPPLSTGPIPVTNVKVGHEEQWWLRPEDHTKVIAWLNGRGDGLYADFVDLLIRQGMRIEETLALEPRHFTGMLGDEPNVLVPGTKTKGSQATIPVYAEAISIVSRCIKRSESNGWAKLFPISYSNAMQRWNNVRSYLGVQDVPTSTLKSLRRTFAFYANAKGMPTAVLQSVMRHSGITTTEGYLKLIGGNLVESSREYFSEGNIPETHAGDLTDLEKAISAYRKTGATPEEVAKFTKEMIG